MSIAGSRRGDSDGQVVRNAERGIHARVTSRPRCATTCCPIRAPIWSETFLGARTAAHQAALGCRFRCTFCGVAAMFRGGTALPPADAARSRARIPQARIGADSIQFYDHNFFDREVEMVPLLEVLARHELPWWCYARADALVNLSADSWRLVRKSRLRMAYIGAETPNDKLLRSIRKGTRSDQTLEVAELCRRHGVIPELSFMVAPPEDPEGETERTFDFIRQVKKVNPQAEIIVYIYTPLPASSVPDAARLELAPLRDVARQSGRVSAHAGGVDRAALGGLCLSCRCALDERAAAPARARLRHRAALPVPHRAGHALAAPGPRRRCARWRAGAIRCVATIAPWELRASQNLIGLLDPRVSSI